MSHLDGIVAINVAETMQWISITASQDCNTLIQDTKNLIVGASAILLVQWNGRSESAVSMLLLINIIVFISHKRISWR